MEKIAFIVDRLNMPPFNKGFPTMTEFDGKSSLELLDLLCEVIIHTDPEQADLKKEATEGRIQRVMQFLRVMKFVPEEQLEDIRTILASGDKDILQTIIHWSLQRFEHLQKRAYLAKYLTPENIAPEYMSDDLIIDLLSRLKELQVEFKEVHKTIDQMRSTGAKPAEIRAEISQLEQEKAQLQNKIAKMKKEPHRDEAYFKEMLKATSTMRMGQEEEGRTQEKLRENRRVLQEVDQRYSEAGKRLSESRSSGVQGQSAEQLLGKLQKDVKDLNDRKNILEMNLSEKEVQWEKMSGWESSNRVTTDEDVRAKRDQLKDVEDQLRTQSERLDDALEQNSKLIVFRQASTMALKKLREKEDEAEKVSDEKRRLQKQIDDKENELQASGKSTGRNRMDLKKYGAIVRDKIESYKKMREELSAARQELVTLQRTEQILKNNHKNLDEFLIEEEKKKGVEGYRKTQEDLINKTKEAATVDQMKGATLEQISQLVEQIGREYKNKQAQLAPLIADLKAMRSDYMNIEAEHSDKKTMYEKVAVGLDIDKQSLERECDILQDDCIREESRFHSLQTLITMATIRKDRADKEKQWQSGDGRMMRDFGSFKDLYSNKLAQQDQLTKQLRKKQKELKENSDGMINQKSNFKNLKTLLDAKLRCERQTNPVKTSGGGRNARAAETISFSNY